MENLRKVISLNQASLISGYHQDYLSSLLRKNEIKGEKMGGSWFTTEEEIKSYVFKQKIRNKSGIIKHFLIFIKSNKSFLYALIGLMLFSIGLYFYNKIEMKIMATDKHFSAVGKPEPDVHSGELQF